MFKRELKNKGFFFLIPLDDLDTRINSFPFPDSKSNAISKNN